jgi:curved DNA-binding protein CbpA
LGAERTADEKAIKKLFRDAALICHPDKGGTDEDFQKVNEAWQVLGDATKRRDYDAVNYIKLIRLGHQKVQLERWYWTETGTKSKSALRNKEAGDNRETSGKG